MPEIQDDLSIGADEQLIRRVRRKDIVFDSQIGQFRPESGCFRSDDFISVHIASLTSPDLVLQDYPGFSLAGITVRELRAFDCKIVRDAQPEDPSHALVFGTAPGNFVSKTQAKKIVKACRWIHLDLG